MAGLNLGLEFIGWGDVGQETGHGISQAHLSKIFDPFFTTKEEGKGTGLGLSISYQIIQNHQGKLKVTSQEGHGALFRIELPLSPK